ncbi:MAG TPA: type I methionyl aminopeptidase [Candidatus Saccharimonadales bacterium]|nr:type I methionyl aminopeptidase [Candidatus Saccharimonadales bacterium]
MKNAIKTEAEITALRESGRMLATVLELMRREAKAGLTPKDMSVLAQKELRRLGGEPAFKGFHGYPDIICISVNEQVQHSIPTGIPFKDGDVVNFDFGVRYKNMVTDAGMSVCIGGNPSSDVKRLLDGTEKALAAGIAAVHDGCHVGDISAAIEHVLKQYRLGIVRELVGHGVGHELHEDPEIPNYGPAGRGPILKAGMTIAIEPITTLGNYAIEQLHDGWTLVTRDGSWSAQFEHTLLVTDNGAEILTHV